MIKKVFLGTVLLAGSLFGKSEPPDYLSFAIGSYDFYRPKYQTFEFEVEYKFLLKCFQSSNPYLHFRPLVGMMATAKSSFYAYLGINFDLLFFEHLLIAPGFAAGYYAQGKGKNLGYPIEFRSGIELGWLFSSQHRLGLHFYHLSNASLGNKNPGEESLVLFYDIPLIKGFPFIRE
jgi:lipid A 3-O-deacylase